MTGGKGGQDKVNVVNEVLPLALVLGTGVKVTASRAKSGQGGSASPCRKSTDLGRAVVALQLASC